MNDLFNIGFLSIGLFDILDILLVTFAFCWVYKTLKETLAFQIILGLFIILGLSFVAEAINLKSINWILNLLSDIWILAFIILFQPELRSMLLRLTQSSLFHMFFKSNFKIIETIDEVIDAAIEMSINRIGALIVFPQTQDVSMSSIDGGIELKANVKKELLISIFNTKSPLHDGAVIINKKMEIVAARCILPLSRKRRVEKKLLGTRHRAGLGLTEKNDAVVLIISEETGEISIAFDGNLYINIPHIKLKNTLKEFMNKGIQINNIKNSSNLDVDNNFIDKDRI